MHTFAAILVRGFGAFDNRCSMQGERCAGVMYAVGDRQGEHDEPREFRRDYGYGYSGRCRGISKACTMI